MMTQWRAMNALLLGEREAQHLGYALKRCACAWCWPARSSSARWSP